MITFRRILVPTDFSDNALSALRYAVSMAVKFGAQIQLVHIVQDTALILPDSINPMPIAAPQTDQLMDIAEREFTELLENEPTHGVVIQTSVRVGSPYHEITTTAKDLKADLIVMGSQGRGAIMHMLMGSVAEKVVRHAPCAVLTVRHQFESAVSE